jgi:photosystem II stability/assembly factor-like uncharacterized protein
VKENAILFTKIAARIKEVFPCNDLNCVKFGKDAQMAIAVGDIGVILRSMDGGKSWNKLPTPDAEPNLRSVFIDENGHRIWVVGAGGVAFSSNDNGTHWSQVDFDVPVTQDLNDVTVTENGRSVWMVGANNLAIHSGDGGKT